MASLVLEYVNRMMCITVAQFPIPIADSLTSWLTNGRMSNVELIYMHGCVRLASAERYVPRVLRMGKVP